jgi:WD40 repeat protein
VQIWDTASGTGKQLKFNDDTSVLALSPDGKTVAQAPEFGVVRLWDTDTGQVKQKLEHPEYDDILSVAFSPDSMTVALVRGNRFYGEFQLYEASAGSCKHRCHLVRGAWSITFSPDSRMVALGVSKILQLFDASGTRKHMLEGHNFSVTLIAFSPDSSIVASSDGKTIRVWDAVTGTSKWTRYCGTIHQLSFSRDGCYLFADRAILIRNDASQDPSPSSPGTVLYVGEQWIFCGFKPLLWLPPSYRAKSADIRGDILVLSDYKGSVTILQFAALDLQVGSTSGKKLLDEWDIDLEVRVTKVAGKSTEYSSD